ncbi:DUF4405 domain-containing protein [Bacteroidota bacterium]
MARFKKSSLNLLVDILSYVSFVLLATTGFLMYFVLPSGTGFRYQVWGLDRHQWGDVHFWASIFFLATILLHLILHWRWIWIMIRGKGNTGISRRGIAGITGSVIVLILFSLPLLGPIQQNDSRGYRALRKEIPVKRNNIPPEKEDYIQDEIRDDRRGGRYRTQSNDVQLPAHEDDCLEIGSGRQGFGNSPIRGNMSLQEVSDNTDVPVDHIIAKLQLPKNVSRYENLGQLRRTYGFHMQDVRQAVDDYK